MDIYSIIGVFIIIYSLYLSVAIIIKGTKIDLTGAKKSEDKDDEMDF